MATITSRYNVGGVTLPRPFKIRRLGHFGFNVYKLAEGVEFYTNLLGFNSLRHARLLEDAVVPEGHRPRRSARLLHALRHGPPRVRALQQEGDGPPRRPEVRRRGHGQPDHLAVREPQGDPGRPHVLRGRGRSRSSAWAATCRAATGTSTSTIPTATRPSCTTASSRSAGTRRASRSRCTTAASATAPTLPQMSEAAEVAEALEKGIDLLSGNRTRPSLPETYDVEGVRLARPFKITRIGPVSLFVADVERAEAFYTAAPRLREERGDGVSRGAVGVPALRRRASQRGALPEGAAAHARALGAHHAACRSACRSAATRSSGRPSRS